MENDTQAPPENPGQVAEPVAETTQETAPPETAVETPPETPPPAPLTAEEIEERAFQRTASWMGRREKEFSDNILRNVTQVLESRLSQLQPRPPEPVTEIATVLDNPDAWLEKTIPKVLEKERTRVAQANQNFTSEIIRHAGRQMDSDPLFENKELGAEVIAEIQKNFGSVDKRVPPDIAARMLVNDAVTNIYRRKISTKPNPLAGNTPGKVVGTITPPARQAPQATPVKLDDMAKKVAAWFGNTDKEISEMLK